MPASAVGGICTCDCDGNYEVTVDEIVRGVALALAQTGAEPYDNADGDGRVAVDDVIVGISNLLSGCTI